MQPHVAFRLWGRLHMKVLQAAPLAHFVAHVEGSAHTSCACLAAKVASNEGFTSSSNTLDAPVFQSRCRLQIVAASTMCVLAQPLHRCCSAGTGSAGHKKRRPCTCRGSMRRGRPPWRTNAAQQALWWRAARQKFSSLQSRPGYLCGFELNGT